MESWAPTIARQLVFFLVEAIDCAYRSVHRLHVVAMGSSSMRHPRVKIAAMLLKGPWWV